MRYWTKARILRMLDIVINGGDVTDYWDDFSYSSKKGDEFEKYWGEKICAVEKIYPPENKFELFSQNGIPYLISIYNELESADD